MCNAHYYGNAQRASLFASRELGCTAKHRANDGLQSLFTPSSTRCVLPCGESLPESRMREIRTSGSTRGRRDRMQGIRIMSHVRGNPETDVGRNLNLYALRSTLLLSVVQNL